MRRRTIRHSLAGLLVVACTGGLATCGSPGPLREWTPDDHGQPEAVVLADDAVPEPRDDRDPTVRAAEALWNVSCAGCHGRLGRGDGAARPPDAPVPDLAAAAWQDARTDDAIAAAIRGGRGMMPEFGSKLPPDAIVTLVAHVRSLREAPP